MAIGFWLAWAFAAGMALLGVGATAAPALCSALYGVPVGGPRPEAWVRAAGLRDLGLAGALAAVLWAGDAGASSALCLATALIAAADLANVVATRGVHPIWPLGTHASGVAVGLAAGVLLLLG
jgi:hypothetical protein